MSLNAFADGYTKGYQAGYDDATEDRATERRAIVAWLREVVDVMEHRRDRCAGRVYDIADAIERGEHLTTLPE